MSEDVTTVRVILQDREDGGLRVRSDELVGLILSGPQKANVMAKIAPAIQAIFKAKGLDVTVRPQRPLKELIDGPTPSCVGNYIHDKGSRKP